MKVSITGTVDSVKEVQKDNSHFLEVLLNQPGEQIKPKIKIYRKGVSLKIGESITLDGTVIAGAFNGSPYKFVKVD